MQQSHITITSGHCLLSAALLLRLSADESSQSDGSEESAKADEAEADAESEDGEAGALSEVPRTRHEVLPWELPAPAPPRLRLRADEPLALAGRLTAIVEGTWVVQVRRAPPPPRPSCLPASINPSAGRGGRADAAGGLAVVPG